MPKDKVSYPTDNIPKDFSLENGIQNVTELWGSIARLAKGRVDDPDPEYPLQLRMLQLNTLKMMVETLEKTHEAALCELK